jgi:ribosomal protein L40E
MARKVLGYIQLIWTCSYCGTQNPGAIKSCTQCGAPQAPDVQFEKVDAETFAFIKDEALIRMAQKGADKHCPYCGTRNSIDAETCVECGSDITSGAKARESGERIETRAANQNPPTPPKRPQPFLIVIILVVLAGLVFLIINLTRTDQVTAVVSAVSWQRSQVIEEYQRVERKSWEDAIPSNATLVSCALQYRYDSDTPQPIATEVCGEPYTIDTGTGLGQVVQDCVYRVYENYCTYTTMDWLPVETLVTSGEDLSPYWPTFELANEQRQGNSTERYVITFSAEGDSFTYSTTDESLYLQAQLGSTWLLEINQFNNVVSAAPAQ